LWFRDSSLISQPKHLQKKEGWIFNHSLSRCMISPSSVCIHRDLFDYFGLFNETFWACEDYDMWLRISRFYPVGLDSTISLRRYAGHADQLSASIPLLDHYRVIALYTCLNIENQIYIKENIKAMIDKKLGILIKGGSKRGFKTKRYSELKNSLGLV
jgi:GT2 family glycosyltransferase